MSRKPRNKKNPAMTAVIYARYSPRPVKKRTNGTDIECESCEMQVEHCQRWCSDHGYEVLAVCSDEGLSGASMNDRVELGRALQLARSTKSAFVAYSLSRWARSTRDAMLIAEELQRAGCQLISLKENIDTSGAYGRFMYAIFSALAELEREIVSERTRDAMRRHVRNGRPMGGNVPFGWRINPNDPDRTKRDGNYVKDDDEQAAISRMQTLSESGLGLRAIGRALESEGILCRGHAWHHNTVARILERNTGYAVA